MGDRDLIRIRRWVARFVVVVMVMGSLTVPGPVHAQMQDVFDTREVNEVILYKGDLVTLKVFSLTRIALSVGGVVNIAEADVNSILLVGQGSGETSLFIWDEYGKRKIEVRVFSKDLDVIIDHTRALLEAADIEGVALSKNNFEGKVVATGKISKDDIAIFKDKILPEVGGERFVNLVREVGDLVQIDVQISELTTTLNETLGFDWGTTSGSGISLTYEETLPSFDGSVGDFFKIGDFARTSVLQATVSALISEGKGRILSRPTLIVKNGEEASFLVGGEIPIRTTSISGTSGTVQENVTYKEYGVDVSLTPEIIANKIDMGVSIEIRDIDAANAVGDEVAFTSRTSETQVLLDDGQTIVIAGLIRQTKDETISRVPFVSSIPIIGALFRKRNTPTANQDQEVVISLTPRIVRQKEPRKMKPEERMNDEQRMAMAAQDERKDFQNMVQEVLGDEADEILNGIPVETEEEADWTKEIDAGPAGPTQAELLAGDEDLARAVAGYVKNIQTKISENISFPYEAKEKGWEGTSTISLSLDSNGNVLAVDVATSSGHEVFDKDAVNTAQILAPYDPFPAEVDLEELTVTVPIRYSPDALLDSLE